MIERRQSVRSRVIYSGVIAYDERRSTMNCVVRNFSEDGMKVVWRGDRQAGLAFRSNAEKHPIPLDWASESERRKLQSRIAQLLSEH
jgi:hypothetical protein